MLYKFINFVKDRNYSKQQSLIEKAKEQLEEGILYNQKEKGRVSRKNGNNYESFIRNRINKFGYGSSSRYN